MIRRGTKVATLAIGDAKKYIKVTFAYLQEDVGRITLVRQRDWQCKQNNL